MSGAEGGIGRTAKVIIGVVVAIVALAVLYSLLFPPYGDYGPRAKLSEVALGMSMARSPIDDFHARHRRLPKDAAEAGLSLVPVSRYIGAMAYDGERGEVRSVVKEIAEVQGKTLGLRARAVDGKLEWRCFSPDIESKHLPSPCRSK